jgi:RES domain-containing protein
MAAATHRRLSEQRLAYRIGDPNAAYPIYSGIGARKNSGRWHAKGQAVIYCAEHLSTALLEKLVLYSGRIPSNRHYITIVIPSGTTYEVVTPDRVPGWEKPDQQASRAFGRKWIEEARSAILFVPSVVARMENNVLINPAHPDFARIKPGLETPVTWDKRLFASTR